MITSTAGSPDSASRASFANRIRFFAGPVTVAASITARTRVAWLIASEYIASHEDLIFQPARVLAAEYGSSSSGLPPFAPACTQGLSDLSGPAFSEGAGRGTPAFGRRFRRGSDRPARAALFIPEPDPRRDGTRLDHSSQLLVARGCVDACADSSFKSLRHHTDRRRSS